MNYIENVPKNIKQTSVQDFHILFGHIKLINVRYHPINNQNTLSNLSDFVKNLEIASYLY
jgi:hypothetical protein